MSEWFSDSLTSSIRDQSSFPDPPQFSNRSKTLPRRFLTESFNFSSQSLNVPRTAPRSKLPLPAEWQPSINQFNSGSLSSQSEFTGTNISPTSTESTDDIIPTAIVIKNIPFSLKKESLLEIMASLGLPAPFALNYHFESSVFRGLAFANFHTPEETSKVVEILNNFEVSGRKLRVEFKKVLTAEQRERIEAQKLEKKYENDRAELDMNDPTTLLLYSQLCLYKTQCEKDGFFHEIEFDKSLSSAERRIVHILAQSFGLQHDSRGDGPDRHVIVNGPVKMTTIPQNRHMTLPKSFQPTFQEPQQTRSTSFGSLRNHSERPSSRVPSIRTIDPYLWSPFEQEGSVSYVSNSFSKMSTHSANLDIPSASSIFDQRYSENRRVPSFGVQSTSPPLRQPKGPESSGGRGFSK